MLPWVSIGYRLLERPPFFVQGLCEKEEEGRVGPYLAVVCFMLVTTVWSNHCCWRGRQKVEEDR
jgi:hypothetical protein